jgi:hypothetical protein
MRSTTHTRPFAESIGFAIAFGHSVTTCGVFSNPVSSGYIHGVSEPMEAQTNTASCFNADAYETWLRIMRRASDMSHERGHDPCDYGVMIIRTGTIVTMAIIRHSYSIISALDNAQEEGTESTVYDLQDFDNPIRLEEHNRVPGTRG